MAGTEQLQGISLESYLEKWNSVRSSGATDSEELYELRGIASSLALSGHARTAVELALASFGPGQMRCDLVRAIFRFAADPAQQPELFALLEQPDERTAAAEGIGIALALGSSPTQIVLTDFAFLESHRDSMISSMIECYVIRESRLSEGERAAAFAAAFELPMSQETRISTLRKLYEIAPFECWDYAAHSGDQVSLQQGEALVDQMISRGAPGSLERLIDSEKGESFLARAAYRWMQIDAAAPINWIADNTERLDTAQRDRIYQGIVRYAAEQREFDTARKWANLIADGALKAEADQLANPGGQPR